MNSLNIRKENEKGFTLLELLIVISIIAILSVALVLVLNPAEALKKSRDAQRISDLSTMKTALGLYLTSTTTPHLGGNASDATCKDTATGLWTASDRIYYSLPGTAITDTTLDSASALAVDVQPATLSAATLTDGTGWIPVNFDSLTGGSPISNLPVDPSNALASGHDGSSVDSTDLMYRYACAASLPFSFEINAQLESDAYRTGADDKRKSDGGNSDVFYEVGTNLRILGEGSTNPF